MVKFKTIIKKFQKKGEKTGWSYIDIPSHLAEELKPGNKKSFRVKGKIDKYAFEQIALLPMGNGDFIMALKGPIRKAIGKEEGAMIELQLSVDNKISTLSSDFMECLAEEPKALKHFKTLAPSHQRYFSTWIESAKTDATKAKRITQAIKALGMSLSFSELMRMNKKNQG